MPHENEASGEALLSPTDMKVWLQIETQATELAARQRIVEATTFVQKYVAGEIGTEEANRLLDDHEKRWEAEGVSSPEWSRFKDDATSKVQAQRLMSRKERTDYERSR